MRRPRKRPFQRRDGMLRDQYRGLDGVEGILIMPRWMYGEPMSVADRDARRAEIGGADTIRASRAVWGISHERAGETLEQLLIALAKGNFAAPGSLVPYADDPRVQPALLEA